MSVDAQKLNMECLCEAVVQDKLALVLDGFSGRRGFGRWVLETRPHLFSSAPVFITKNDAETMAALVQAIERISDLPSWRQQALAKADATATTGTRAKSVFMGYDFHIGDEGPRLIEINTNAGGAYLNLALLKAMDACCEDARRVVDAHPDPEALDQAFLDAFKAEMRLERGGDGIGLAVIVDDDPASQYLLPEFELAQASFKRAGVKAVIADPGELRWQDGRLVHEKGVVDLVYNRLVDFSLRDERHDSLRQACLAAAAVITPSPRTHALLADKRHLAALSNAEALVELGVSKADAGLISSHVPPTLQVTADNAETLWATRKRWFFKPGAGHAGKAAYRGDKMTKGVWQEIRANGNYVAQEVAQPALRGVLVAGVAASMKSDIRLYTYDGRVLLMAARLYQGQTTNFRTLGGGFAPVLVV